MRQASKGELMHSTPNGFEAVFEDGSPAYRRPKAGEWFLSACSADIDDEVRAVTVCRDCNYQHSETVLRKCGKLAGYAETPEDETGRNRQ